MVNGGKKIKIKKRKVIIINFIVIVVRNWVTYRHNKATK